MNLIGATMVFGPAAIVLGVTGLAPDLLGRLSRMWCRWILWASGVDVYAEGAHHVGVDRPQIIVSNHQSWYDVFAVGAVVPKHFRFVGKKELDRIPVFGHAWRAAGHISIDRRNRQTAIESLRSAEAALRSDNSALIMFPEGTRSPTGQLARFKKGAFMLAFESGVELVPAAVIGSRDVMSKSSLRVTSRPIILRFGDPVDPAAYADPDDLIDDVRARVATLLSGSDQGSAIRDQRSGIRERRVASSEQRTATRASS